MRNSMPHPSSPHPRSTRTQQWKRLLQYALPVGLAGILLLFCGTPPQARTISEAPAKSLLLLIRIFKQYATTSTVTIQASFRAAGVPIILSGKQTFQCDGTTFPQEVTPQVTLPRQLVGGTYNCIYTDERGTTTSVIVSVPQGAFAITSPTANTSISIPATTHPANAPTPSPHYEPDSTNLLSIHYTLPLVHEKTNTVIQGTARCGNQQACGTVDGPTTDAAMDRTYTFSDINTAYRQGFDQFIPGPGSLELTAVMPWDSPATGFALVNIMAQDTLSIPVVWTSQQTR
jgi:hypothetical protein